jgi:hypothetical protein
VNGRQQLVLTAGVVLTLAMLLFPPWLFVYDLPPESHRGISLGGDKAGSDSHGHEHSERPAGYHFIATQNAPQDTKALALLFSNEDINLRYVSIKADTVRLAIQLTAMILIVGLMIFLLRARQGST